LLGFVAFDGTYPVPVTSQPGAQNPALHTSPDGQDEHVAELDSLVEPELEPVEPNSLVELPIAELEELELPVELPIAKLEKLELLVELDSLVELEPNPLLPLADADPEPESVAASATEQPSQAP
jgi:hypothetical protein